MAGKQLHFVMVPMMAQGHMIPMFDMAWMLAESGLVVTLVTTPTNAARFKCFIDAAAGEPSLSLRFLVLDFPAVEAGLPPGCENIDTLPSKDSLINFIDAASRLRGPLVEYLYNVEDGFPSPSCIISDMLHPWTIDVAMEFGIPRLMFNGFSCFACLCFHNIFRFNVHEAVEDPDEPFVMPGLPSSHVLTRKQLPGYDDLEGMSDFRREMTTANAISDGVVINSFLELESQYVECLEKATGKKAWTVGPLSLYNRKSNDDIVAARGNKPSVDVRRCKGWLDSMETTSVLYVSFGSIARIPYEQMVEIGNGLRDSGHPFIWVIRPGDGAAELDEWLAGGFEESVTAAGSMIIRGWAPQVVILSHPAVGGFITHCGWNSTLEGLAAGVPMITWPQFGDQFLNEKLVVDVLGVGVAVGVKEPRSWGVPHGKECSKLSSEAVRRAVMELMDSGPAANERRRKAIELGKTAKMAMEADGSTQRNLKSLIQDIRAQSSARKEDS